MMCRNPLTGLNLVRLDPMDLAVVLGEESRNPLTGLNLVQPVGVSAKPIAATSASQSPYGAKPRATE